MSGDRRPTTAQGFDDLLDQSRRAFDALLGTPPASKPPRAAKAPPEPSDTSPSEEAARRLTARHGDRWRWEVVEKRRDGDEAVVVVAVAIDGQGPQEPQEGRTRIGRVAIAGTTGGLAFSIGGDAPADTEAAAFARATTQALDKCAAAV